MKSVLFIEDRDSHEEMGKEMLKDLGYVPIVCRCLADVRVLVPTLNPAPNGILLDLEIPSSPGTKPTLEVGRDCGVYLRNQVLTKTIPIIAYSAYTDDTRIPGWADLLRFSAVLEKHQDPLKKMKQEIQRVFK
jgi:CheY-like chemotaxis protein